MLDICGVEGRNLGIAFISKMSLCMVIGPMCNLSLVTLCINGISVAWVDRVVCYLGLYLLFGKIFNVAIPLTWVDRVVCYLGLSLLFVKKSNVDIPLT